MYRPKRLLKILVVEDDLYISRKIEVHISRQFGREAQILRAKTVQEGKDIIEQGFFDIAIIDLLLPDGHGEKLIELIREKDLDLPIIVQTTEDDLAYQAKVHNKYGSLIYLEKPLLFAEIKTSLNTAANKHKRLAIERLSIVSHKKIDILNVNEVCYVTKITESNNLHVELYDYEKKDYSFFVITDMTMAKFMETYNKSGHFLRCHNSYIVNRMLIRSFSRTDSQITMLMPKKGGGDVIIDVSEKYRKAVREALKGLF